MPLVTRIFNIITLYLIYNNILLYTFLYTFLINIKYTIFNIITLYTKKHRVLDHVFIKKEYPYNYNENKHKIHLSDREIKRRERGREILHASLKSADSY